MFPSVPSSLKKAEPDDSHGEPRIVLQFLEPEAQMIVHSGFLYLPLPFDPDMEDEMERLGHGGASANPAYGHEPIAILRIRGDTFIRSLDLMSIIHNYEQIDAYNYNAIKSHIIPPLNDQSDLERILPGGNLQTIILEIMPHFIRKNRGFERKRFSREETLDFLSDRIGIPERFMERAEAYAATEPLREALKDLDKLDRVMGPLPEGPISVDELRLWARGALEVRIIEGEKVRLQEEIGLRAQLGEARKRHIALLLFFAETGSFEFDGFGFSRIGAKDVYVIYKRTGEYIIKDYYDQSYRFPDCRVGVSTAGPLRPVVLDHYKHPFLLGFSQNQEICMRGYDWPSELNAENVIRLLEDGINSLLYGYDPRRRNGYHSLDPTLYYVKGIEFVDYRI